MIPSSGRTHISTDIRKTTCRFRHSSSTFTRRRIPKCLTGRPISKEHHFPCSSLVYTFMNLDKVCDLDAKLFEKSLCSDDGLFPSYSQRNTTTSDKYVEDRARRFFRELPKCGKFDNIWFYELIRTMVHGEHMAALSVLLPNWDLTLSMYSIFSLNIVLAYRTKRTGGPKCSQSGQKHPSGGGSRSGTYSCIATSS